MDEDEDDYVFYGTPIEREEDTSARKRKAIADAGQLRSLPSWKQEVRDEEGRRRFHGAFTGGYSAGFYNTVGSKEGWTPQTFTSSRKNRAEVKQQSIYSFLDDDDIKDMGGQALETSSQFDTFGFTAAEVARKQVEKEQQKRPSAIPGPVPDELVLPATNSIGVKLLVKMGWRRGHSIKDTFADSLYDARREARKALLAFSGNEKSSEPSEVELSKTGTEDISEKSNDDIFASQSTPVYVLYPKQDLYGLGYDPFKHAPEFRDRKRLHNSKYKVQGTRTDVSARGKLLSSNSGRYAPGFGIGALEELDVEDEDIYASGFEFVGTEVEEDEPSSITVDKKLRLEYRKQGVLSGFKVASSSDYNIERFPPPVIPPDFEPCHKFTSPPETFDRFSESPPPEVPPPEDNSLRLLIEGFATLVARCGKLFEDLSKEKNKSNPLFSFLSGGNGHDYYARKLWEAKQKNIDRPGQVDMKSVSSERKMTAESRGKILGEKPLERSFNNSTTTVAHKEVIVLQSNLSDTFTKPTSVVDFSEHAKPFKDDPAKQKRFEQFIKDKYQGGLRSTYSGGMSTMSDNDRARERLDFEAAAEAIEKGEWRAKPNLQSTQQVMEFLGGDSRFVPSTTVEIQQSSQIEDTVISKNYPKREEFQWRPSPILCKRFDLIDPFMGKPPPMPRARSKLDSLIFMPDSFTNEHSAEAYAPQRNSLPTSQSEPEGTEDKPNKEDTEIEADTINVERPVDLYKAIFSDDEDDDDDVGNAGFSSNVEDPEKKIEGVNTTLNRLVAGDFLESLGKELGLEVPAEKPHPVNIISSKSTSLIETTRNVKAELTFEISNKHLGGGKTSDSVNIMETTSGYGKEAACDGDLPNNLNLSRAERSKEGEVEVKKEHRSRKRRSHSRHHHRRHSSSSDGDSSYDRSKSKSEKRTSSKEKNREHSDHHSHKSRRSRSPSGYSSHSKGRDLSDDNRNDKRSSDRQKRARRKYH